MQKIKLLIREFVNKILKEALEHKDVNAENVVDLYSKLVPIALNVPDLKKGLDFAKENIGDYHSDDFVQQLIDGFLVKINDVIKKKNPDFFKQFDTGYSGNMFKGSKYKNTQNMDLKEISSLIKKELDIEFPGWKFSVKISRFSGGQSLSVDIKDMPYSPYSEKKDESLKNNTEFKNNFGYYREDTYNPQYIKDQKKIKEIVNQYNMDDSDAMTDYFHVRFYDHIRLDEEAILRKFYPENEDLKRREASNKEWDERRAKAKEIADSKKGKFKKGEEVILVYDKPYDKIIPSGEYKAIITKVPNGRSLFSYYSISFDVDKKFNSDGTVAKREIPAKYKSDTVQEKNLKPKE